MTRLLIVDDDPAVGASLAAFLEDYGYEVALCEDAEAALVTTSSLSIDLAIVDLRLPMMNGEELILALHADRGVQHFLIHTGAVHYHLPDPLVAIGMCSEQVLYKPIGDLNLLLQALEAVLASKSE